jgi:RNA polymerase sigma factor (sigma-70 family)
VKPQIDPPRMIADRLPVVGLRSAVVVDSGRASVVGARHRSRLYAQPDLNPDSDVIAASLEDPDRFGEIFDRYSHRVFGYAAKRIPREDVADVTGDVFLRAFRIRDKYDLCRPDALPWLFGIATNVIGEYVRKHSRRARIGLRPDTTSDQPVDDLAAARADASRSKPILDAALATLKPRDRSVLILYAVEGLSYQEISDALGIPTGTVRSRLNRARAQAGELILSTHQIPIEMEHDE